MFTVWLSVLSICLTISGDCTWSWRLHGILIAINSCEASPTVGSLSISDMCCDPGWAGSLTKERFTGTTTEFLWATQPTVSKHYRKTQWFGGLLFYRHGISTPCLTNSVKALKETCHCCHNKIRNFYAAPCTAKYSDALSRQLQLN